MRRLPTLADDASLAFEVAGPKEADPNCRMCSFKSVKSGTLHNYCIPPETVFCGEDSGTVLIVCPPPTQVEDAHNAPSVNRSGNYLRQLVDKLWSGRAVFDMAIRCAPGKSKINKKHYSNCRGFLADTYRKTKPEKVVLMGTQACSAYLGSSYDPMSSRRGFTFASDGTPIYIAIPPYLAYDNRVCSRLAGE